MSEQPDQAVRPPSYAEAPPQFRGGHLALDFANTLTSRNFAAAPKDRLSDYRELTLWANAAGLLSKAEARRLEREARKRPEDAAAVLASAKALREALARLLTASDKGNAADLILVNAALARAPVRDGLVAQGGGSGWGLEAEGEPLERPLWPILWEGAALLTSDQRTRISACAGDDCRWLFLDLSRNKSRRWCSMEDCGNRAKARRHYAKTRGG